MGRGGRVWEDQGEKDGGLGGGFSSRVTNKDLTEEEPASLLANLDPEQRFNFLWGLKIIDA